MTKPVDEPYIVHVSRTVREAILRGAADLKALSYDDLREAGLVLNAYAGDVESEKKRRARVAA